MSSQGLERRFLCGRQMQGHVIGARFLVVTAWRLSSAVSRNQRHEACVQPCAPDDPLAFASLRQAGGCAMRLMIALRQIVPTAAAAVAIWVRRQHCHSIQIMCLGRVGLAGPLWERHLVPTCCGSISLCGLSAGQVSSNAHTFAYSCTPPSFWPSWPCH